MIGLLTFLCSCNNDTLELKQVGKQMFETDFVPSNKFSGVYKNESTGKEYIYLGNGKTEKSVSFFSLNGEFVKTINFRQATEFQDLNDISIWSLDTILVLSKLNNSVLFINSNGKCIHEINLEDLTTDPLEFESSWNSDFLYKQNLYFHVYPDFSNLKTTSESQLEYYNKSRFFPYILKVENLIDSESTATLLIDSFYANFIPLNYMKDDIPLYSLSNDKINIISLIPDTLYCYDLNGKIYKKCFVEYEEKTMPHNRLFENTKNNRIKAQDHTLWQTRNASFLSKIIEANKTGFKYLFAYHKFEGNEEDCWDKRNWSWLVYNEDFNKLQEFVIKDYSVSPTFSFSTSKGVFIKVKPKFITNYEPTKTHFNIYTVE